MKASVFPFDSIKRLLFCCRRPPILEKALDSLGATRSLNSSITRPRRSLPVSLSYHFYSDLPSVTLRVLYERDPSGSPFLFSNPSALDPSASGSLRLCSQVILLKTQVVSLFPTRSFSSSLTAPLSVTVTRHPRPIPKGVSSDDPHPFCRALHFTMLVAPAPNSFPSLAVRRLESPDTDASVYSTC